MLGEPCIFMLGGRISYLYQYISLVSVYACPAKKAWQMLCFFCGMSGYSVDTIKIESG